MQRRFGFAPLGPADWPVKNVIFAGNSARMYKYDTRRAELDSDEVSRVRREYAAAGGERRNLAYGYVTPG